MSAEFSVVWIVVSHVFSGVSLLYIILCNIVGRLDNLAKERTCFFCPRLLYLFYGVY